MLNDLLQHLSSAAPMLAIMAGTILTLAIVNRSLRKKVQSSGESHSFSHPLIMLGLTAFCIILVILAMPVGDQTRGQLLGLLGLSLTAIITLASTTFFANAMAGMMIRIVASFKPGDFIETQTHFGRVTERGLFHTEIQTEDRDLTTLPNLYLTSNPVKVVHSTGTIVSALISLGYDQSHTTLEPLLLQAIESAELTDGHVYITELGDFAVTYRVAGFLKEVRQLLSARSRLRILIMDHLHRAGVEIASPTIMLQKPLAQNSRLIPKDNPSPKKKSTSSEETVENLIFDKADIAANIEALKTEKENLANQIKEMQSHLPSAQSDHLNWLKQNLADKEKRQKIIEETLNHAVKKAAKSNTIDPKRTPND